MAGEPSRFIDYQSDLNDPTQAAMWLQKVASALNEYLTYNLIGNGVPTIDAPNGATYRRLDGGTGTTLYVRELGAWVGK